MLEYIIQDLVRRMLFIVAFCISAVPMVYGGKTFILGFLENASSNYYPVGHLYLVNPSSWVATVNVSTPSRPSGTGSVNLVLTVPPQGSRSYVFPKETSMAGSGTENKGILVSSDVDILVQAINSGEGTSDAFDVPAVEDLGTDHVTVTYKYRESSYYQGPYEIGIVAIRDNTNVSVHLSGQTAISVTFDSVTYNTNDIINLALNAYDIVQLQFVWSEGGDFTGTRVTSNFPTFVMSGALWGSVEVLSGVDHLVETVPPVACLGTMYFVVPFAQRTTGDVLRVVATSIGANFTIKRDNEADLVTSKTLKPFEFHQVATSSRNFYYVISDNPVMVVQFLEGRDNEVGFSPNTDPSMVILRDITQWSASYIFTTMRNNEGTIYTNYINIVVTTVDINDLRLDGSSLKTFWTSIGESGFSGTQLIIVDGTHTLRHLRGKTFGVVLYGQSYKESYAFCPYPKYDTYTNENVSVESSSKSMASVTFDIANKTVLTTDIGTPAWETTSESTCVCNCEQFERSPERSPMIWLSWQPWDNCTDKCGVSTKRRSRDCQGVPTSECLLGNYQHSICIDDPCPYIPGSSMEIKIDLEITNRRRSLISGEKKSTFGLPSLTDSDRLLSHCSVGTTTILILVILIVAIFLLDASALLRDAKRFMCRRQISRHNVKIAPVGK